MKFVKIVHTADLHIGSHYTATPEISQLRKQEQLENLRHIIKICHEQGAELLLIAGDLFETVRVDEQLLAEVQDILEDDRLNVFISPGNHDPAVPDSSYMDGDWPLNVHIFKGGPECVEIPEKNICVWGLGFQHTVEPESLLTDIAPKSGCINILVMHSELVPDNDSASRFNPVTPETLAACGMDYCALGHKHNVAVPSEGNYKYLYSGCPFGRGFDEQGDKGVLFGSVGSGFAKMRYISCGDRQYHSDRIDVSGCEIADDYVEVICDELSRQYGENYTNDIYDLTVFGELAKGVLPDIPLIKKRLMEKIHYVRLTDITTTELDIEMLMKDGSLKGAFVRTIVGRMNKDEKNRDKYLRALLYGLRAFDGEVRVNEDH